MGWQLAALPVGLTLVLRRRHPFLGAAISRDRRRNRHRLNAVQRRLAYHGHTEKNCDQQAGHRSSSRETSVMRRGAACDAQYDAAPIATFLAIKQVLLQDQIRTIMLRHDISWKNDVK